MKTNTLTPPAPTLDSIDRAARASIRSERRFAARQLATIAPHRYLVRDCSGSALQFTGSNRSVQCADADADLFDSFDDADRQRRDAGESGGNVEVVESAAPAVSANLVNAPVNFQIITRRGSDSRRLTVKLGALLRALQFGVTGAQSRMIPSGHARHHGLVRSNDTTGTTTADLSIVEALAHRALVEDWHVFRRHLRGDSIGGSASLCYGDQAPISLLA